jgi:serine/threonine protein kinase
MKRVCAVCDRISEDGNLWCQELNCPAGSNSLVFSYGEFLGDIEIVRLVRVISTATMAHDSCQEQLKREAIILAQLAGEQHPMLPVLLPPYGNSALKQRPYGKTVFRDETKYYEVFEYVEGELLRDVVLKNPQPWYQHAAWITISIADAVAFLHVKGKRLHLNLSPDVIHVHYDKDGIPRPLLLDLGVVGEIGGSVDATWLLQHGQPAYTAPELFDRNGVPTMASDVYGLGVTLYEMLAGRPAFPFRLLRAEDVRTNVVRQTPDPLTRTDLSEEALNSIYQSIDKNPANRQADVRTFAKMLRSQFGEVPVERKRQLIDRRVLAGIVAILIIIMGTVIFAAVGAS